MNFDKVQDSGIREEFSTGSKRDTQQGKGNPSLIPIEPLRRLAKHYENGAVKYGKRNWEKGQPLSRYYDSAMRHMWAYMEGDYNEDHLAAAAWNIFSIIATQERIIAGILPKELDDIGAIQAYQDHLLEEGSKHFDKEPINKSQPFTSIKSPDNIRAQNIHTDQIRAQDINSVTALDGLTDEQLPIYGITLSRDGKVIGRADTGYIRKHKQTVKAADAIKLGEVTIGVIVDTTQAEQALHTFSEKLNAVVDKTNTLCSD